MYIYIYVHTYIYSTSVHTSMLTRHNPLGLFTNSWSLPGTADVSDSYIAMLATRKTSLTIKKHTCFNVHTELIVHVQMKQKTHLHVYCISWGLGSEDKLDEGVSTA